MDNGKARTAIDGQASQNPISILLEGSPAAHNIEILTFNFFIFKRSETESTNKYVK
ncbi:MAG TPA: hypothetical protein DD666_13890 [Advenella kashmirensis]|uniref:Uncharacterized protein n=1 Tax=Advenella kashmirensis TaxID=310575 RepID=A0A356LHV4_9BURK|nr:hypothetical protein [Advenella kashmirensis]